MLGDYLGRKSGCCPQVVLREARTDGLAFKFLDPIWTDSGYTGGNMAIKVLDETVYSDGSGVTGLYEVYGQKFSGIHTGEKTTVTPLGIQSGHRGGRAKGMVRTAVKAIEAHLEEAFQGARRVL